MPGEKPEQGEATSQKLTVPARQFAVANELYGKQVSLGEDTFARLGDIMLQAKDKSGKPVEVPMTKDAVGSFLELMAHTVGAAIISFNRKHIGYLRTLVINADDKMLKDDRKLHIPLTSGRFPLPGVVISIKDAIALASILENVLQESAKVYPPVGGPAKKDTPAPDATESVEFMLY